MALSTTRPQTSWKIPKKKCPRNIPPITNTLSDPSQPKSATARKENVGELGKNASKKKIEIRNVWVACNPSGFAFVEFEDACDAEDSARGVDGKTVCGRCARVELSTGRAVIVFAVVANHRMANEVMATSTRTTDATSVESEVIMSEIILKEARDLGAAVRVRALVSSEFVPRVTAEAMNMPATAVPNPTH
ncbi:uncharacterized protein LOC131688390 [Topomyia yanbarensis]|uniref:uncharacterized protein LOC131688390 n=1 Tax=Topomyia yanbarensis TaxID=2498891 RepID=UPI00273BF039|nr:uncharacterized protein LOC131688390 [Topomyia yanbarensis]